MVRSSLVIFLQLILNVYCSQNDSDIRKELSLLRDVVENLQKQINDCTCHLPERRLVMPESDTSLHIAFDAMLSANHDYSGNADVTVPFDNVITNRGNAYASDIGIFAAPVTGTYLFTWTIRGDYGSSMVSALFVNGRKIASLHTDGSSQTILNPVATKTVIIDLQKSDHVMIKMIGNNVRGPVLSNSIGHSSFAGTLLFPN